MTIRDLLKICRERLLLIVLTTLVATVIAGAYSVLTPKSYTATATAYVRVDFEQLQLGDNASAVGGYNQASQLSLQKVKTFLPLFSSRAVAQTVAEDLGLPETGASLASRISASNDPNTVTVNVSATASNPDEAKKIADAVVDATGKEVRRLEGANSPVGVVLMTSADLSDPVVSPSVKKFVAVGFAGGLFLGLAIAVLLSMFDTKIRTVEKLEEITGMTVLAAVPKSLTIARTSDESGDQVASETIRKLRTALSYTNVDHQSRVYLITSAGPGEGKSSIARSLARVIALAGNRVVLIDADLRKSTVAESFGVSSRIGLSQLLAGNVTLEAAMVPTTVAGLSIIPAGDNVPNPSEMLGSDRMRDFLNYLSSEGFVVVVDAPPVLPVTDSVVLSSFVPNVVMVVAANQASEDDVRRATTLVEQGGGHISGYVLNRVPMKQLSSSHYGSTYYGREEQAKKGKAKAKDKMRAVERDLQAEADRGRQQASAQDQSVDPLAFLQNPAGRRIQPHDNSANAGQAYPATTGGSPFPRLHPNN